VQLRVVDERQSKIIYKGRGDVSWVQLRENDNKAFPYALNSLKAGSSQAVIEDAFRKALLASGHTISDTAPLVYEVSLRKFEWSSGSRTKRHDVGFPLNVLISPQVETDMLPTEACIAFDVTVRDADKPVVRLEVSETVAKEGAAQLQQVDVEDLFKTALKQAVAKALSDDTVLITLGRRLPHATSSVGNELPRRDAEPIVWQTSQSRKAWIVAVGVTQFRQKTIPPLPFAKSDAEGVRTWFTKQENFRASQDNVRILCDEQATRENVFSQIDWLRKQAMPEDLVIVYFAGHGAPELASDGKSVEAKYLVLFDTDPAKLFATGLPLDELTRRLDTVKAKVQVVILEACYAGAVGQDVLKGTPTADLEIRPRFIQEMGERGGRVILSASSGRQIAIGSEDVKGGLFTHYLLKAWSDAGNKRLIADCFEQVWDNVRRAANKLGSTQEPTKYGDQNVDVILGK
jgi:hypothetical protein